MKIILQKLSGDTEKINVDEIWSGEIELPPCEKLVKIYHSEFYDNFILCINFQCGEINFTRNIFLDIEDENLMKIVVPILEEYIEFVEAINFLKK